MAKNIIPDLDALVERSQQGDTEAFAQIYDALVKPIYRYVYYRVDPETAEDITEEAFLKIWQNLKKYKKGASPFSSWAFRIAHNLVVDHYRKDTSIEMIDETVADTQEHSRPELQMDVKLTNIRLHKVIRRLPEHYQQIVILKYINELENSEIAEVVGKSEGAVRVLQFRALEQLRDMLSNEKEDL